MKNSKGLFTKTDKLRIPRKLKKKIPSNTFYCYTPTSAPKTLKDGKFGYTIKLCPFYTWRKFKDMKPVPEWMSEEDLILYGNDSAGYCKLINYEIDDQCKSCGLKIGH